MADNGRRRPKASSRRPYTRWISLGLIATVALLFGRSWRFGFCNFDDYGYVIGNPIVKSGLNSQSIRWALTTFEFGNWHPLTWLSLELDVQLWGLKPAGFHLTNVLLHAANTTLLFWLLCWTTRQIAASGVVAALFAVHPLHVESVVWISERKDVLSTLFWILTLLAYTWYAERPSLARYAVMFVPFGLGLSSKAMLVTLPCVMLLWDYWPLRRRPGSAGDEPTAATYPACAAPLVTATLARLIVEKLPLLALCAVVSAITLMAQSEIGAVASASALPLASRLMNVPVAYATYLMKTVYPVHLAIYYPHPEEFQSAGAVVASALLLVAITAMALSRWRRSPYLIVGWLWFLGTLVPVIGLVQVGQQAVADRYTYIPLIGVFLAVVWGFNELTERRRLAPKLAACVACGAVILFSAGTWVQVGYWQSNVRLWSHAVEVTGPNPRAFTCLGWALMEQGKPAAALPFLRKASVWAPNAHRDLGLCLIMLRQYDEATKELLEYVRLEPDNSLAHHELGKLFLGKGDFGRSAKHLRQSLRTDPNNALARAALEEAITKQARQTGE